MITGQDHEWTPDEIGELMRLELWDWLSERLSSRATSATGKDIEEFLKARGVNRRKTRRAVLDETTHPDVNGFFEVWLASWPMPEPEGEGQVYGAELLGRYHEPTFGHACDRAMVETDKAGDYDPEWLSRWIIPLVGTEDEARQQERMRERRIAWRNVESLEAVMEKGIVPRGLTVGIFALVCARTAEPPSAAKCWYDNDMPRFTFRTSGQSETGRAALQADIAALFPHSIPGNENLVVRVKELKTG